MATPEIDRLSISNKMKNSLQQSPKSLSATPSDELQDDCDTNSNTNSPQTPQRSQSQPNGLLTKPNHMNHNNNNDNDTDDSTDKTITSSAFNYAATTISGAYSFMSSFIPITSNNTNNKSDDSPSSHTVTHHTNTNNDTHSNAQSQSHFHSKSLSQIPSKNRSTNTKKNGTIHTHANHNNTNGHPTPQPLQQNNKFDPSKPDFDKYPMKKENDSNDARDSNLSQLLSHVEHNGLEINFGKKMAQPHPNSVVLRSTTYKQNGKKQFSAPPVFRMVHAQAFKTDLMIDHIAMHPLSWFNQNIALDDMSCFTLIVHLQVKSIKTSFITYHVLDNIAAYNSNGTPIIEGDRPFTKLLDLVLNCNDRTVRNNRLKLIPRIVEGPYPVKRVVENRPVLLGNKVIQNYFRGANYFEIDSKVDESMVAASIIKLCHRFAKRIVVDMAWTIQGETDEELPERLLCGCTIYNMDFGKCNDVSWEMNNCPKLVYKKDGSDGKEDELKENEK